MREETVGDAPQKEQEDLLYGRNAVWALLESQPRRCLKVWLAKGTRDPFRSRILDRCRETGIPLQELDGKGLERMLPGKVHQGVAARTAGVELLELQEVLARIPPAPEPVLVVVLDHLEDPHNAGAIVRSAEAVGALAVLLPLRRGALPTGAMVKASTGAALRLPLGRIGNVGQDLRLLQEAGLWVVGLEAQGERSLFETPLSPRMALVVGSEGKGLGRTTLQGCDEVLHIPMRGESGSLNGSVAAALGLYEWFRSVTPVSTFPAGSEGAVRQKRGV